MNDRDNTLSDAQAARRRDAALKRALNTPHKAHVTKKPKKKPAKKQRASK